MGCILGFCLVASFGQNLTAAATWSSKNQAKRCGSFFAPGIKTFFGDFAWQRWIVIHDPHEEVSTLGHLIDTLGRTYQLSQPMAGQTFSLKPSASIWTVRIVTSFSTTQLLIFLCSNTVCNGQFPACSGVWTNLH